MIFGLPSDVTCNKCLDKLRLHSLNICENEHLNMAQQTSSLKNEKTQIYKTEREMFAPQPLSAHHPTRLGALPVMQMQPRKTDPGEKYKLNGTLTVSQLPEA